MKTIGILLLGLMLLISTNSCSTLFVSNKQIMQVKEGMKQVEIKKILGTPDFRRFDGKYEEWEYRSNIICVIRFYNGEVTGMDTFNTPVPCIEEHVNEVPIK